MMRRRDLLRTTFAALAASASGWAITGSTSSADTARPETDRAEVDPKAAERTVAALHAFAGGLYGELATESGNVALSPYSVAVALAMVRNGARGDTAAELDRVLHVDDPDRFNSGMNTVAQCLDGHAGKVNRADSSTARITLSEANALWGQRSVEWRSPFLTTLDRYYAAGMRRVDYIADAEAARKRINDWVDERTDGRIDELLPHGLLDQDTRLVLVNALHFKAPWEQPFHNDATRTTPFTRIDGTRVNTPMMRTTLDSASYTRGDHWQAVRLPYAGKKLAMTVVLPDSGQLPAVQRDLGDGGLAALLSPSETTPVNLQLPRWTFRSQLPLQQPLATLGMPTAFTDRADLSGMTTDTDLRIDAVQHEAFIAVDEQGTEAAAATGVVAGIVSAPAQPVEFTVDRPFLFVIHDVATGVPLFLGRVTDPSD